jgi:hypothetical protein
LVVKAAEDGLWCDGACPTLSRCWRRDAQTGWRIHGTQPLLRASEENDFSARKLQRMVMSMRILAVNLAKSGATRSPPIAEAIAHRFLFAGLLHRRPTLISIPENRSGFADGQLHTTLAAITGLRKRGYEIDRKSEDGKTTYRITAEPELARRTVGRR